MVVSACVTSGINAVGVSPFPHTHMSPGACCDPEPDGNGLAVAVAECLKWGLVPIIHGDAVLALPPDRCTILSGDTILFWLATHLPSIMGCAVNQCVFLTDVRGVYDSMTTKNLIQRIQVLPDGSISLPQNISEAEEKGIVDVTGGLKGKLEAAAAIAMLGVPVYITEAGSRSCLEALKGIEPKVCTAISLAEV